MRTPMLRLLMLFVSLIPASAAYAARGHCAFRAGASIRGASGPRTLTPFERALKLKERAIVSVWTNAMAKPAIPFCELIARRPSVPLWDIERGCADRW